MRIGVEGKIAISAFAVMFTGSANAADLGPAILDCGAGKKIIKLRCDFSNPKTSCDAKIKLAQEGKDNSHIYSCEVRITPQIKTITSFSIDLPKDSNFSFYNYVLTQNLEPGWSQIQLRTQRPIEQTEPVELVAKIKIEGSS